MARGGTEGRRLRHLVVAAAVMAALLVSAQPAAATEPSGARTYRPLDRLTHRVEEAIGWFSTPGPIDAAPPLSPRDRRTWLEQRAVRADSFIGAVRARAHDALHILVDEDLSELVHRIDAAMTPHQVVASLETSGAAPSAIKAAEPVALQYLAFVRAVEHLRAVTEPWAPARVCPVEGDTWFRDEWEAARPWERVHQGVDMHTELGTPLLAVEDGVVIQASWHWLGGRQVYLKADATGDVYYYAHLEHWPPWLWTGTRLEAGDYLGLAGASGNADSPHLHLGWMPGSGSVDLDTLQNPYPLMYELCF